MEQGKHEFIFPLRILLSFKLASTAINLPMYYILSTSSHILNQSLMELGKHWTLQTFSH